MNAVLAGSTGLVGSHFLSTLLASSKFSGVVAYTRKPLSASSPKLIQIQLTDTSLWPSQFPTEAKVFFSGLGTTRGQAGSLEAQRKIDYDLNLALATEAKAKGVEIYVLVSSGTANAKSMVPYTKMKGELEDSVRELGFKHLVIIRPGLIVGERSDSRPPEYAARAVAGFLGRISGNRLTDSWAQDADVIAKAGVNAALQCIEGTRKEEGPWVVGGSDIVRLGRTEWKDL